MARALAAAIFISLLAGVPGVSGSRIQTPRTGGTVVFGPLREPPCLNVFVNVCTETGQAMPFWIAEEVLPGAYGVGPDFTFRPRLVSRVELHESAAVHTHLPHSSRGPLERRGPGHARATSFSPTRCYDDASAGLDEPQRTGASDSGARHEEGESRPALPLRGVAAALRQRPARSTPSQARTSRGSGRTGSTIPKTGRPIGSGPFLVSAGTKAGS